MKDFYITTPIYYVNDKPHIGHAYTTVLADVIHRYNKLIGNNSFFLTGLDEHGLKVQQSADLKNISPQEHCDKMAPEFIKLWDKLGIQFTDFIRTTESRHIEVVQHILTKVNESGDIYFDEYEGLYSVSEERFITEKEFESGNFREVKKIKEKNYFFKMSKYQQKLIQAIKSDELKILPQTRKNEVLGFLENQELNDLCISRPKSRLNWGIEIPFDKDYVTYVWFDALINYISSIKFSKEEDFFYHRWPADIHLIGKDILTTHAVYWPTMLMSLGLPLPGSIFAHGWWLTDQEKMSKSLGNVINPLSLIDKYGPDSVRYFLMREMVLGQDANFSEELFIKRYNADLANDLGNLVSRVTKLISKFYDSKIPKFVNQDSILKEKYSNIFVEKRIENFEIHTLLKEVTDFIQSINIFLEEHVPWKQAKSDLELAGDTLYHSIEAIRVSTKILEPVMPRKCMEILQILSSEDLGLEWGSLQPETLIREQVVVFPRIVD